MSQIFPTKPFHLTGITHIKAFYVTITAEYQFLIEVTITGNIECGSSVK